MPGGLRVPPEVLASWPETNVVNPQLQGPLAPVIVGILGSIAVAVVIARYISRFRLQSNAGCDDWVFLAAMPGALGLIIGVILGTAKLYSNIHLWDIQMKYVAPMRKLQLSNYVCYVWSTCLIKLSILLFYRRLTSKSISPKFVYALWSTMGLNVAFFIISVIVVCFPCYPMSIYFEAYWQDGFTMTHPADTWHCLNEGKAVFYISLGGVILDFITTILPFTLFLKLRMPRRQKIAMCLTFFGGFIVCGAGVARTWTVYLVYFETYDMPWYNYWFWLATGIEVCTALICASSPSLKFYFRHYLDVVSHPATPEHGHKDFTNTTSTNFGTTSTTTTFNDMTSADSKRRLLFGSLPRKNSNWSGTGTEKSFFFAPTVTTTALMTTTSTTSRGALSPLPKSPLETEEKEMGYFSPLASHNTSSRYIPSSLHTPFRTPAVLETEELHALESEIVGNWHARTLSAQEDELRAMGILAAGAEVDVAKAVGEHPVFYPWQEKNVIPEAGNVRVEEWDEKAV